MAWGLSVAAHVGVAAALYYWPHAPTPPQYPRTIPFLVEVVTLADPEPPGPLTTQEPEAGGLQEFSPPTPTLVTASVPDSDVLVPDFAVSLEGDTSDLLSALQLAGAVSAGGGAAGSGGGGGCDTARIVEQVLQRDPRVRMAVEYPARLGKL